MTTLLFERLDMASLLSALPQIPKADRILLYRYRDLAGAQPPPHAALLWILRRLNRKAHVGEVDPERYLSLWQETNSRAHDLMERAFETIRRCPSVRILGRLIPDAGLERYYKIRLMPQVLSEALFRRIQQALEEEGPLLLRPAPRRWSDPAGIGNVLGAANGIRLLGYPCHFMLRVLARGFQRRRELVEADVVMPISPGFLYERVTDQVGHPADFLMGGEMPPSRWAFYFSDWQLSPQAKQAWEERIRRMGSTPFDPSDFKVDPSFLRQATGFLARLFLLALRPSVLMEPPEVSRASGALARHFLIEWLFAVRVKFKVSMEFQEHSSAHVLRTFWAQQMGRSTLGIHHGNPAAPWFLPAIGYATLSRLCVWGEAFARMHRRQWEGQRLVAVGAYRSDFIWEAARPGRFRQLQQKWETRGAARPLIVMLFPSMEWYVLKDRITELLGGLRMLRRLKEPFSVVCRFRTPALRQQWLRAGLSRIMAEDPRILEDHASFTTFEWIALADFLIGYSHSTALIEAAAAGKPCLTFDLMLTGEKLFGGYGEGVVLKTGADLVQAVERILSGRTAGLREAARSIAADFSYFPPGECLPRFRAAVHDLAEGVSDPLDSKVGELAAAGCP